MTCARSQGYTACRTYRPGQWCLDRFHQPYPSRWKYACPSLANPFSLVTMDLKFPKVVTEEIRTEVKEAVALALGISKDKVELLSDGDSDTPTLRLPDEAMEKFTAELDYHGSPARIALELQGVDLPDAQFRRGYCLPEKSAISTKYDVAIITALQDTEYEQMKNVAAKYGCPQGGWEPVPTSASSSFHFEATTLDVHGQPFRILGATANAMGMTQMAVLTMRTVQDYQPSLVILIGIAAALDPATFNLGDVVLFETTEDWDLGKHTRDEDGKPVFERQQDSIGPHGNAVARMIQSIPGDTKILGDMRERAMVFRGDDASDHIKELKIQGVRSSCVNYVVDDAEKVKKIRAASGRYVEVLEMEAGGFYKAMKELEMPGLVIKGISDYAAKKDSSSDRKLAAFNAASVAFSSIRRDQNLRKIITDGRAVK